MRKRSSFLLAGILFATASTVYSLELKAPVPLEAGGRFEYEIRVKRDGSVFPWNYSSTTASDRIRLMLDLRAGGEKTGMLYLKGAAHQWNKSDPSGQKYFEFEQGDYSWSGGTGISLIGFRVFANERRFFTNSFLAPLLDDDRLDGMGGNRGARLDGVFFDRLFFTWLYSALGDEYEKSNRLVYLKTAFTHDFLGLSLAYLNEDRSKLNLADAAVVKMELNTFYKWASLIFSYEQSGTGSGLFFPTNRLYLGSFVGDNFSSILPDAGAFFAEARLSALPLRKWGRIHFSHRYSSVGRSFIGDMMNADIGSTGYTTGAYFTASEVSLNGRIVYTKRARLSVEDEKYEKAEASVWADFKNGSEVFLRGGIGKTCDALPFTTKENYVHAALKHRIRNLQSGVHLMFKDMETDFSEQRYAWDARLAFGGNLAIYWRAILTKNFTTSDAVYAHFEFRPGKRLFLLASYGKSFIGDDPFLLEDPHIDVIGDARPVYHFSVRGDF